MKVASRLRARGRVIVAATALLLGTFGVSHVVAQGGEQAHVSSGGPTPLPVVSAHRVGDHIVVRYRFRSWPSDARRQPAVLLLSSRSADLDIPPLTEGYRFTRRSGRIRHPVGLGPSPFRLLYSVYSRRGIRSRTASAPVR
jgi:hypothetical protein